MNDFFLILTLTAIVSIVLILFILIAGMYERNKLEKLYSLETNKLKNDFYKKYKREVTKKDLIFAEKKLNSTKYNKKYKRKETKKDLIFTQKKLNSMSNGSNNLNDMLTWLIYYDLLKHINEYNDMSNFEQRKFLQSPSFTEW